MNKNDRIARAKDQLVGIDAGSKIRDALAELRELHRAGRRRAEVDGAPPRDLVLDVPVLCVENSVGYWKIGTTSHIFQGQVGAFHVVDKSERLAMKEIRWALAERLFATSFCNKDDARLFAAKANVYSVGRVPFCRIFSPGGL